MKHITLALILAVLVPAAAAQNVHDLMQEAAYQERALGDLVRANEIYRLIVESHSKSDRELAAQSLYQMAINHETLGHQSEARQAFLRLVSEYPEQEAFVSEARARGIAGASVEDVTKQVIWDMNDTTGMTDGEPSPDGRYVSFAAWKTGDLGVKDLETGEIKLLTTDGSWDEPARFADESSWSRDGSRLAFVWWQGDEAFLKVVDRSGGEGRTLVEGYLRPMSWTSDGRILADWRGDDFIPRVVFVDSETGAVEVVQELPERRPPHNLDLSPDGRWILLDLRPEESDDRDLFLMPPSGGALTPIAGHPGEEGGAHWHPDGESVVFKSDRSGTDALWRVRIEDGGQVGEPELVFGDMRHAIVRGFARDGRLFVERSRSESSGNLYTVGIDQADLTVSSDPVRMPLLGIGYNAGASFSGDGRYMSYISQRPNSVLVIRDLTTGREVEHELDVSRLLRHRIDKPLWRPGANQLLVADNIGVRIVDAFSGESLASLVLRDALEMHGPRWSPDGESVWGRIGKMIATIPVPDPGSADAFSEEAPPVTGWQILPENEYCEGPAVHPTDGTVAYWCDYRVIYRLNPSNGDVSEWWRVPEGEPPIAHYINGTFAFTPDGGNLIFHRWREGADDPQTQVWRLPVGGSEPVRIGGTIPTGWGLELHPSGEQAAYTVLDGARNEMWVLGGLE